MTAAVVGGGARGAARAAPRPGARARRRRRRRGRGRGQPQLDAGLLARRRDLGAAGRARPRRLRDSRSSRARPRRCSASCPTSTSRFAPGGRCRDERLPARRSRCSRARPSTRGRSGPGPRYLPAGRAPPRSRPASRSGRSPAGPPARSFRVHLELFADRKVIVVPAGIGVAPSRLRLPGRGRPLPAGSSRSRAARASRSATSSASGASRSTPTTSPRSPRSAPVRAYVGGRLVRGPLGAIPLTPHAEIVLELGPYLAAPLLLPVRRR